MRPSLLITALFVTSALAAAQIPSSWDRLAEWTVEPDSSAGTTTGNPAPDSAGNLVWSYESASGGGGLGSVSPWYTRPTLPLVWDASWFGAEGAWARSNDFGPVIRFSTLTHVARIQGTTNWHELTPVLRWRNATGASFELRPRGSLKFGWNGTGGASPVDVDYFIGLRVAATGALVHLASGSVSKPTANDQQESLEFPMDLGSIQVEPGDELVLTHRAQESFTSSRWVWFADKLCLIRDPIGTPFCGPPPANSTGIWGAIHASGSTSVQDDELTLKAFLLPRNTFGYFLCSRSAGFTANPGGSDGNLCLGGAIGRFVGPGQIVDTGDAGAADLSVGLRRMPTPTGLVQVQPGETWHFQFWHRDGASTNFTHGLRIAFQ